MAKLKADALDGPGAALRLRFAPGELRQRDVEQFMAAVRQSALGTSAVEGDGKVLRAAVACGWVVEPVLKVDKDRDDVANMEPWKVAAFARQIDSLYVAAMTVPKA
ncbi:MAG: hypothetical protein ABI847_11500 [Anaerolineales bacterium]